MPKQTQVDYGASNVYLAGAPARLGSVTLDASLWSADSNGDKIVQPGMLISKPTASGKWGPYAAGAPDGRQTAADNLLIVHTYVNLRDGDQEVSVLLEGIALKDKVTLVDGTTKITKALQDNLRSKICDVKFDSPAAS